MPGYLGYGLWRHLSFGSEMFFVLRRCECHCYSWVTTWGVWALIGDSVESVFFHSGHSAKWFPVYQSNPSTRMVLHLHCLSQVFPTSCLCLHHLPTFPRLLGGRTPRKTWFLPDFTVTLLDIILEFSDGSQTDRISDPNESRGVWFLSLRHPFLVVFTGGSVKSWTILCD